MLTSADRHCCWEWPLESRLLGGIDISNRERVNGKIRVGTSVAYVHLMKLEGLNNVILNYYVFGTFKQ